MLSHSEAAIERALAVLKSAPGQFESIVERWASVDYGDRFRSLSIRGRRPDDVTVNRWPDAHVERADGSWDVLEVTMREDFPRYVRDLIDHVANADVSGFVLVMWAVEPSQEKTKAARELLVAAGVPPQAIDFVFRGRLVREIAMGRHAHLWPRLGLSATALPFRAIDPTGGLIGVDATSSELHPTAAEFGAGRVHRPRALRVVQSQLADYGFAEVRGQGAAGKTVLAAHVIQDFVGGGLPDDRGGGTRPAFYAKVGQDASEGEASAVDAFVARSDEGVLFIVDDIHLNEQLGRDLEAAWSDAANGSKLLLVGRRSVASGQRPPGRAPAVLLIVERADLIGVYRRIALREAGEADPPLPPSAAIDAWLQLFRGDLVVFGSAVKYRLRRLLRGVWDLTEDDARDLVRERYLADERENPSLLGMALLATVEVPTPAGLVAGTLETALARGTVVGSTAQDGRREYVLAHPGLGRLLVAAAPQPVPWSMLDGWTTEDAGLALRLAHRRLIEDVEHSTHLLQRAWDARSRFAAALIGLPATQMAAVGDALAALDIASPGELDDVLSGSADELAMQLLDDPRRLPSVLLALGAAAPRTIAACDAALGDASGGQALGRYLTEANPSARLRLTRTLLASLPAAATAAATYLADPEPLAVLLLEGRWALGFLTCPEYARLCRLAPALGDAVDAALRDREELVEALVEATLGGPPGSMARTVPKVGMRWPVLAQALEDRLADPETQRAIASRTSAIQTTELPTVLRFASGPRRGLGQLIEIQVREHHRARILAGLRRNPSIVPLYRRAGTASPLLAELAREVAPHDGTASPQRALRTTSAAPLAPHRLRLIAEPDQALLTEWPIVIETIDHPATPASAAAALFDVMVDPAHRDTVVDVALTPEHTGQVLLWARERAPDLFADLVADLRDERGGERLARSCVVSTFDHVAGLLRLLEKLDLAAEVGLEQRLSRPPWVSQLLFAGQASSASGWAALLEYERVAAAILTEVDAQRWRHRWRSMPPEQPHWLRSISRSLHRHRRPDLQQAPSEHVVRTSRPDDWRGVNFGLPQLDSVLRHSRELGDPAAIDFLRLVLGPGWLDEQFGSQSTGNIALLVNSAWYFRSWEVTRELVTDGLRQRIAVEGRRDWNGRSADSVRGALMLAGTASLIGIEWRGSPVLPRLAERAIGESYLPQTVLTQHQVLLSLGLRTVLTDANDRLRLTDTATLAHHDALWQAAEPTDPRQQRLNAWMLAWFERSRGAGWTFEADDLPVAAALPRLLGGPAP